MSDSVLTNEQAMKVLTELLTNPGFRQRYEEKPAAALLEIGIPATTIANLPASCLYAYKVDVEKIAGAQKELTAKAFSASASMAIPNIRMNANSR
jgi:putative modified peptide